VVQGYSDGTEVAWIDPTVDGQPEPEHPAPVLSLSGGPDPATSDGAATPADPAASTGHSQGGPTTNEPAGLALFFAILALAVGLAGVVLGYRAGRRTVSS
jgi:hypothetical protein